jgi:L-alanine-DL-glutamate epimerase-like enolase superfamily enzyme
MVLLRLRDEDGVIGLGEAVPLSLRGGATLGDVVGELEEWAEHREVGGLSAPARCAVEVALMDLRERRGGEGAGKGEGDVALPCNASLVAGPPQGVAAQAERWAQSGFTTFKLKLGAETASEADNRLRLRSRDRDVAQVRAVREAVGPVAWIRVDANEAWDVETAKETLAALEPLGIELAEQPVAGLEAMAELAAATSIPLAADESVTSLAEAEEAVAKGACAYTGIKLSKVGGPEEALAIAGVLPAYVTSALDGPVGIAAAARVAASVGGELAHGLATQPLFASTIAEVECELRQGGLHLPPGPGLGVEIDEQALEAHRI